MLITFAAWLLHFHLWFVYALYKRRNDVADVAWGLGFLVIASAQLLSLEVILPRNLLVFALVAAWAIRLSLFIFMRGHGSSVEDPRYQAMRQSWGKNWKWQSYLRVFWLQALIMIVVSAPIFVLLNDSRAAQVTDWVAASITVLGLLIESVADFQKSQFRNDPSNRGKFINTGLWRYARHPNYFGEMLFWVGLTSFTFPAISWAWVGPIFLIFLLLKVSGIPLLEKKYVGNKDYEEYSKRTNLLIPFRLQ
jgi:steroid 5-alpha reductase family enzyme